MPMDKLLQVLLHRKGEKDILFAPLLFVVVVVVIVIVVVVVGPLR